MIDKLREWIQTLLAAAFREGFEAGYVASIKANTRYTQEQLTFTHVRDDLARQEWANSKVRRDAAV